MFFASMLLGGPGREILLPDPGFPIYSSAAAYSGAQPVCYPLVEENGFAFTAESVLSRLTERTSLIILNAPANPTGGVNDMGEIDKLIKGLKIILMSCFYLMRFMTGWYFLASTARFSAGRSWPGG